MPALNEVAASWLKAQTGKGLHRSLKQVEPLEAAVIRHQGRELVNFSSNDYFGLSQHEDVKAAAIKATERYGAGAGASRLVTGNHALYAELEAAFADYKDTEAALVFGSGYMATLGTITSLVGEGSLILSDKLAHACMIDASKLSGAVHKRFVHNDLVHLETLLQKHRSQHCHCLILTETIFSMDGDAAPLAEILTLASQYDAWVLSDDAHGLGFVSPQPASHHIQLGTMSKGLGSYGGYVCASQEFIDWLTTSARSLIYTTGLPPATIASATKALEILKNNKGLREKPIALAKRFCEGHECSDMQRSNPEKDVVAEGVAPGLLRSARRSDISSPIVPLVIGESDNALRISKQLYEKGFWVSAIRPPTVPLGTARLRVTFTATHTEAQVGALAEALNELCPDLNSEAA